MTIDEATAIHARLDMFLEKFAVVTQIVTRVEENQKTESQRCIYREKIEAGYQASEQQRDFEHRLRNVELKVAAIATTAGIASSVVTAIIMKAIGG